MLAFDQSWTTAAKRKLDLKDEILFRSDAVSIANIVLSIFTPMSMLCDLA